MTGPGPATDATPKPDDNGLPMDTWRIAGTSIHEPYPCRQTRRRKAGHDADAA